MQHSSLTPTLPAISPTPPSIHRDSLTPTDSVKVAETLWVGRKRLDLCSQVGNDCNQRRYGWSNLEAKKKEELHMLWWKRQNKTTTTTTKTYTSFMFCCSRILAPPIKILQYAHSSARTILFKHLYLPNLFQQLLFQLIFNSSPPNYSWPRLAGSPGR